MVNAGADVTTIGTPAGRLPDQLPVILKEITLFENCPEPGAAVVADAKFTPGCSTVIELPPRVIVGIARNATGA